MGANSRSLRWIRVFANRLRPKRLCRFAKTRTSFAIIKFAPQSELCNSLLGLQNTVSSYGRNPITLQAFINSGRFGEISPQGLGKALQKASFENEKAVQALINSGRFGEISIKDLGKALQEASRRNEKAVQAIINSGRFGEISVEDLGKALRESIRGGNVKVVQTIINSGRFKDIDAEDLRWAMQETKKNEYTRDLREEMAQAICVSFNDVSPFLSLMDLRLALWECARDGRAEVMRAIFSNHFKFIEENPYQLGAALWAGAVHGRSEIVQTIMDSKWFDKISSEKLQETYKDALKEGYPNIAKLLLNSSRGKEMRPLNT